MLPHLIISTSKRQIDKAVGSLLKHNSIPPSSVMTLTKEGASLKIDSVRSIVPFTTRSFSDNRAVILYDFETARQETQNALLKTLEEDSDRILFIIVSANLSSVLSTILSRVKCIQLAPPAKKRDPIDLPSYIDTLFSKTDKITRDKATSCIDELIAHSRNVMKQGAVDNKSQAAAHASFIKECINSRSLMLSNNLNPQMVIDHVLLFGRSALA